MFAMWIDAFPLLPAIHYAWNWDAVSFCIFHNKIDRRELLTRDLHSAGFFVVASLVLLISFLFFLFFISFMEFSFVAQFLKWICSILGKWKCLTKFRNELEKFCSSFSIFCKEAKKMKKKKNKRNCVCPTQIEIFRYIFKGIQRSCGYIVITLFSWTLCIRYINALNAWWHVHQSMHQASGMESSHSNKSWWLALLLLS